jgi:hypothetical protein
MLFKEAVMAMSIVTIDTPDKVVTCDANGSTQHLFNVKNTSGRALTIGAKVLVDTPALESWLKVDVPAEQELGSDVLTQIPVKIQVPPDGPPGRYTYRLLVYSTRKAGEEFTEGAAVAFEVPERETKTEPPPPPNRWWIWVAGIVGVLLLGGVLTWLLLPAEIKVPNLKGQRIEDALSKIEPAGFTFDINNLKRKKAGQANVGKVVDQMPPGNSQAAKGTEIVLVVGESDKGVVLPYKRVQELKVAQPKIYMQVLKAMPRSVEPAPE